MPPACEKYNCAAHNGQRFPEPSVHCLSMYWRLETPFLGWHSQVPGGFLGRANQETSFAASAKDGLPGMRPASSARQN